MVCLISSEYRERLGSESSQLFCLRVMVGAIILYDHVHPAGAFAKRSAVDVDVRQHVALSCLLVVIVDRSLIVR